MWLDKEKLIKRSIVVLSLLWPINYSQNTTLIKKYNSLVVLLVNPYSDQRIVLDSQGKTKQNKTITTTKQIT